MLNELLDLIVASMKETAENRIRFATGEGNLDNADHLSLVSAVFKRLADDPAVSPDLKG